MTVEGPPSPRWVNEARLSHKTGLHIEVADKHPGNKRSWQ